LNERKMDTMKKKTGTRRGLLVADREGALKFGGLLRKTSKEKLKK